MAFVECEMPSDFAKFTPQTKSLFDMGYVASSRLNEIANEIKKRKGGEKLTVRDFLLHFGITRRKVHVRWWIDKWLSEKGLVTSPDYKTAWIDGEIELREVTKTENSTIEEKEDFVERLRILDAANRRPSFVTRDDSLLKAKTIMAQNDFSQLPVMAKQDARSVDGIISWQSIGLASIAIKDTSRVADCMATDPIVLDADYPILDAIPIIIENQVVLVQDKSKGNVISGLITITDLAEDYHKKSGPFMVLGQIEFCVRKLLVDKFTIDELKEVKYSDDAREVNSVADLNFNEYIQLMRKGNNWEKLGLSLDKGEFTKNLELVRDIRNDVMHFSSEPLEDEDHELLHRTLKFLKNLIGIR